MIYPSTFSIVGFDPEENAWGVAVASKFPAVGAVVPWAQVYVGAIATQSFANTSFGPRGLELIQQGLSAEAVLEKILADDPDREHRQVGIVDKNGLAVTFTGKDCFSWAGGIAGKGYAIQGNILASNQVVTSMENIYQETQGDLPTRLYAALLAGDRSGGDRRGRQSAAILVVKPKGGYGGYNDRWIDYRVDDDPDPIGRLGHLLELHNLYFGISPVEDRVKLEGKDLEKIQKILTHNGYAKHLQPGLYDAATQAAFASFIGNENFEQRAWPQEGLIDRPVLNYIFNHFGEF